MALRGLLKTTCRLLWFTIRRLDRLLVYERFFDDQARAWRILQNAVSSACRQQALSFWVVPLGKKFFQFGWLDPAADAAFHYPGHSERIQRQGSHPPACSNRVHP